MCGHCPCALTHDRSILLVDEGTSALDQKNADIVEKSLLSNPDLTLLPDQPPPLSEQRKAQFDQVYQLTPACAEAPAPRKLALKISTNIKRYVDLEYGVLCLSAIII